LSFFEHTLNICNLSYTVLSTRKTSSSGHSRDGIAYEYQENSFCHGHDMSEEANYFGTEFILSLEC